ncbi:MAG: CDP-alcohol phosphatidyltransferase family protein [Oscillospiraceae bacterium]|nr:CDP-alcohol phosphatidyltransferase family protein [Oscillospiraceae bacterium]
MSEKEKQKVLQDQRADTDRIFTLPNILSFFRLALIPPIVLLYEMHNYGWAFGLLLLSGVTDVVDGWIARTFHLVSDFGKAIDPIADKLTQIAVLLCLMPMKYWWVVAALVLKEVSIGVLTLVAMKRTHSVFSAGWYGKLCTATIYLSMFVLILWRGAPKWFVLGDCILIVALIILSFVNYFIYFTHILRETREDSTRRSA